jgi:hypothetical protein
MKSGRRLTENRKKVLVSPKRNGTSLYGLARDLSADNLIIVLDFQRAKTKFTYMDR